MSAEPVVATACESMGTAAADLAIQAIGLCKAYRARRGEALLAVDDVSFAVRRGECLGLVGESGSGKTTIAKLLLGIVAPDEGHILVNGKRRGGRATRTRDRRLRARELQMVFQDPFTSLDPRQTPQQVVEEVLSLHYSDSSRADRHDRAASILGRVGLDERHRQFRPDRLSGGQRQRVGIARALAADPDVVLLDEAVSGLDVSIQAQILNLLADLQAETGVTLIFISHDLSVIRQVADRVIVLRQGRIVESGDTASVFDKPQHSYTKVLRAAAPRPGWRPQSRRRVIADTSGGDDS